MSSSTHMKLLCRKTWCWKYSV